MKEWNLSEHILDSLWQQISTQLAEDPMSHLHRVVAGPRPAMQYNCSIIEDTDPPKSHTFIFRVRYDDSADENVLVIWDAFYFSPAD